LRGVEFVARGTGSPWLRSISQPSQSIHSTESLSGPTSARLEEGVAAEPPSLSIHDLSVTPNRLALVSTGKADIAIAKDGEKSCSLGREKCEEKPLFGSPSLPC